jgi:acyl carrier protein
MALFEELRGIIASTLKVAPDRITPSSRSEELAEWDSLGHVNLMMTLEQSFDVFLDVEDFPKLVSVPAIMAYLQEHARGETGLE